MAVRHSMGRFETFLRHHLQYKEIGWADIGEKFTRYALWRTRWFNIYLHQLDAPQWHPECHDHPWGFIAILLWRGYMEKVNGVDHRRRPGAVLFRPATFVHNVITPYGRSWSLIFTTRKSRDWGFKPCDHFQRHRRILPWPEYREMYEKPRM